MMKEDFLHYLWQYQYFDKQGLRCTQGESLEILHPGHPHIDSGPDFAFARLKIEGIAWMGQVEIHLKASDWMAHQHQKDPAYDAVVLHVVWEEDEQIRRMDGSLIPCLELSNRVSARLRLRYEYFQEKHAKDQRLPCQLWLPKLSPLLKVAAIERSCLQRLEQRAVEWQSLLQQLKGDWEQLAYQQLCRYLGGTVNQQPFLQLAHSLPWKQLRRLHSKPIAIEALVFGHAGFLNPLKVQDDYQQELAKQFHWLMGGKVEACYPPAWKWSRMRPSSFPSLRLAQLSSIVQHRPQLLDVLSVTDKEQLSQWLSVPRSPYWQQHYHFGKRGSRRKSWAVDLLAINWVVPLLYAYGKLKSDEQLKERALYLLQQFPAEKNRLLRIYEQSAFPLDSAADTQGALQLWKHSCQAKKCLSCPIGVKILSAE